MKLKKNNKQDIPRFSRRWLLSAGRSLFWVAIVTLLIWVYADMEFVATDTVNVTIRLTAGLNSRKLLLAYREEEKLHEELEYQDVKISFRARGSRSSLARLKRQTGGPSTPVVYDVAAGCEPGKHDVPAADVLKEALDLDRLGVTVLSVSPSDIRNVIIDKVLVLQVPVVPQWEDSPLNPEAQGETVEVIISDKRWRDIEEATTESQMILLTEKQSLQGRAPGESFTLENARIIPRIGEFAVTLAEPTASFQVKISPKTGPKMDTLEVKVNVQVLTPPSWPAEEIWQKFTFEPATDRTPWTNVPINVSGPAEDVAKLKRRLDEVQAFIVLTADDMKHYDTPWTRDVVIRLPRDLNLKVVGEKPKVSFWVRQRKAP